MCNVATFCDSRMFVPNHHETLPKSLKVTSRCRRLFKKGILTFIYKLKNKEERKNEMQPRKPKKFHLKTST